jgi:hypothetical protein
VTILTDYVLSLATRGPCTCGKCIDAPPHPKDLQPPGHTVDLTFFKVSLKPGTDALDAQAFEETARAEFPGWFDGAEHNYIEMGAALGDQGLALMTIAVGHLLGVWRALSPDILLPNAPSDVKMQLAGMGFVAMTVASRETALAALKVLHKPPK